MGSQDRGQGMRCDQCGCDVIVACANLNEAGTCNVPRQVLEESGWIGGNVSGRDFPPAVRALCAEHQRAISERQGLQTCQYCRNGVRHPCPSPEHALSCDRTGILRVGRPAFARTFTVGELELGEGLTDTEIVVEGGPELIEIDASMTVEHRTTLNDLLGIRSEGVAALERDIAEATAEQERRTADMEQQRASLTEFWTAPAEPAPATVRPIPPEGLTINWDAVQREYTTCGQCGGRVSSPCMSLDDAQGCELPARMFRERFMRREATRQLAREMPPAVRAVARRVTSLNDRLIREVEEEERAVLPWCELCGRHAARPCTTMLAAGGCEMPGRVLDEAQWMPGARLIDPAPAVGALATWRAIEIEREAREQANRPGYSMAAPPPIATAFAVCGPDGQIDINTVTTTAHTTMVTFLVASRNYEAPALINDLDTTLDAWQNTGAIEGFTVIRVAITPHVAAPARPVQAAPPPEPPRERAPRRRAIRA
jgi:hypothetical protein